MPSKYSIKSYAPDGYYHIFNKGIDGRTIFVDKTDYDTMLSYIVEGLTPRDDAALDAIINDPKVHYKQRREATIQKNRKNFSDEIKLFAYNLLPSEFNLLLQQRTAQSMQEFMRSLLTRYSMYFNKRHKRKGTLFESAYKAILITDEQQLLDISFAIHKPDTEAQYSSRHLYQAKESAPWINTTLVPLIQEKIHPNTPYTSQFA